MISTVERFTGVRGAPFMASNICYRNGCSPIFSVFKKYVHTTDNGSINSKQVIISPALKRELTEKRSPGEKEQHIFDGLPLPGDKFYEASLHNLAEKIKKNQAQGNQTHRGD